MSHMLTFILATFLSPIGSFSLASAATSQTEVRISPRLVHFSIINMSGKIREAHVRNIALPLPVAESVALQAAVGEPVRITSSTNQKISRVIVISASDEGHLFPVN